MTNNLVSQASMMRLNGLPNDLVQNLDPIALLIFIPICDKILYPWLARIGIRFTPIKKIAFGFACGCLSMVVACVIQYYIYEKSPCGYHASDSDCIEELGPPDISVWVQTPAYVLIALSEIFASITGLEYAFTNAPKNMRGLVTGVFWFSNAFSSALWQAFVPLATDPHQVWLYGSIAIISIVSGIIFWFVFKEVDKAEEAMNALPTSTYRGRKTSVVDAEAIREERERQDKIRKSQGLA
jgi:proton-dependent oligopeptide transporter, POT family